MIRMIQRAKNRMTTFRSRHAIARDFGEVLLDTDARPGGIGIADAESLSGHAENKERAYLVKLYAAKVARGEGVFETPPVEAIR